MSKVAKLFQSLTLSAVEIANRSGLSKERIAEISQGDSVSLDELRALARGLRIPMRAFLNAPKDNDELSVLFRQPSTSRPDLGLEAAHEFVSAALAVLPDRKALPNWILNSRGNSSTYAEAVEMADRFRANYCNEMLEPLTNLPEVLMDLGGLVLSRLDTSRFEGASLIIKGYAFIFVSPRFSGRMLFTLAHELGHLFAHHRDDGSAVFDLASQIGGTRHASKVEAFVDAFASNLLLPSDGVAVALTQIRKMSNSRNDALGDIEILILALLYGVSFEVAARRCEQLELLPEGGAYSLAEHIKKTHGSAEKLAEKLNLPNRASINFPRVSENVLNSAVEKIDRGEISIGWATDRFGCSANDIYSARAKRETVRGNRH